MRIAVDSSFLVSCYALEVSSDAALSLFAKYAGHILVSPLTILEVTNGLRARVFRGKATDAEGRIALGGFEADVAEGSLQRIRMPAFVWERARDLALQHTSRSGVRSLDILHVAVALEVEAEVFLTFDRRQAQLAQAEGLETPIQTS